LERSGSRDTLIDCLMNNGMKVAGFLLLLAGWGLVLSALILLPSGVARAAFALTGVGVEALGLTLAIRSHMVPRRVRR
jgi:threonine/homoserine efflux transporter RhtA